MPIGQNRLKRQPLDKRRPEHQTKLDFFITRQDQSNSNNPKRKAI
jgi:hypothetical protein